MGREAGEELLVGLRVLGSEGGDGEGFGVFEGKGGRMVGGVGGEEVLDGGVGLGFCGEKLGGRFGGLWGGVGGGVGGSGR